jgi:hypothetical protein
MCKLCGSRHWGLAHVWPDASPKPAKVRLEAALKQVAQSKPVVATPATKAPDRAAYMREYMKARRAKGAVK